MRLDYWWIQRERDREARPLARSAPDIDPAAVKIDDRLGDRKAEAGPVLLGGEEGFEDALPEGRAHAPAGVGDEDLDFAGVLF